MSHYNLELSTINNTNSSMQISLSNRHKRFHLLLLLTFLCMLPMPRIAAEAAFWVGRGNIPEDKGDAHPPLVYRELVRQSVVLAALHFTEWTPADWVLDGPLKPLGFDGPTIDVDVSGPRHGKFEYSIRWRDTELQLDSSIDLTDIEGQPLHYIAKQLAAGINTEVLQLVSAASLPPAVPRQHAEAPALNELQYKMDTTSQFIVLRHWHARAADEGLTPPVLEGLARGYAIMGQLTRFFWNAFPNACIARSLLYSELLQQAAGDAPSTVETIAFVNALNGYHAAALTVLSKSNGPRSPMEHLVELYCRFNTGQLLEMTAGESDLSELAALLTILSVENTEDATYVRGVVDQVIPHLRQTIRAYHVLNNEGGIGSLHQSTTEGPRVLWAHFNLTLPLAEGLPTEAVQATLMPHGMRVDLRQPRFNAYRDFYAATADLSFAVDGYPAWQMLGKIVWDTHFYLSQSRLNFMAVNWSVETDVTVAELASSFFGYPLENVILAYNNQLPAARTRQLLEAQDLGDVVLPMAIFIRRWTHRRADRFGELPRSMTWGRMVANSDDDQISAAMLLRHPRSRGQVMRARELLEVSPYSPQLLAKVIETSPEWQDLIDEIIQRQPDNPRLPGAIGERFMHTGDAEKAIPYLETAAEALESAKYFALLADAYLQADREDLWLEANLRSLDLPDSGLGHARTRQKIALHYIATGRPAMALPYSTESARSYAEWALRTAMFNHLVLGSFAEAERYRKAANERYGRAVDRDITYYALSGMGNRDELAILVLEGPPGFAHTWGQALEITGNLTRAIEEYCKTSESQNSPQYYNHAALLALNNGDIETALSCFQKAIDLPPQNNPPLIREVAQDLAQLFINHLNSDQPPAVLIENAEKLRNDKIPDGYFFHTDFNYHLARFLMAYGLDDQAVELLWQGINTNTAHFSVPLIATYLRKAGVNPLAAFNPDLPRKLSD